MGYGRLPIGVSVYQGVSLASDTPNYRRPMENWSDRKRKLELGCLEISVRPLGPMPLGVGRFPTGVSIYQGCSASPDTSSYRTPTGERARSKAGSGTWMSRNISYGMGSAPLGFGRFPIGVSISQGGSVAADTSNYRMPKGKTRPIESGNWNWDVWKYQLGREGQRQWVPGAPGRCKHLTGRFCFI